MRPHLKFVAQVANLLCRRLLIGIFCVAVFVNTALAATHTVSMRNLPSFSFSPASLSVSVGDTVTWVNSQGSHDTVSGSGGVPSGLWNSNDQYGRLMRLNERFSFTFNQPGVFPYYCTPHWTFGMNGTIEVIGANVPPSISIFSPGNGETFSPPANITVQVSAFDSDGTIARVDFFMNGSPIGSAFSSPYSVTVNNLSAGTYTFSATATDNSGATASASVSVNVTTPPDDTPPSITTQPISRTAPAGADVTFTAAASGSPPLAWQWFFNGSPISGASASVLVLSSVTAGQAGEYFAVVNNPFGSATSSVARLTLGEPPACMLTFSTDSVSVGVTGGLATVSVVADPECAWTASNTNNWIILLSGNSGVGPDTITFSVLPNLSRTIRTGILLIGDQVLTITQAGAFFDAKGDFNRDGHTDFLWQHISGRVRLWLMDGTNRLGSLLLRNGRPAPGGSRIVGTHDFNQDTHIDILWQQSNGGLLVWLMNGTNFIRTARITSAPLLGAEWQAVAIGDLNHDQHGDILFRHNDGYLLAWLLRRMTFTNQVLLNNGDAVARAWRVAGLADVNRDSQADIIWQGPNGSIVVWFMNGLTPTAGSLLSNLPRQKPAITGLGDLNEDGQLDFIFRNPRGQLSVWWMSRTNRLGTAAIEGGEVVSRAWKLVAPKE